MKRLLLPAAVAAVCLLACTGKKAKHYDPIAFPPGFLWGTATAAHQVEGGNDRNDWWAWEHVGGKIKNSDTSGAACDEYHLYDQDFALAQSLGQNAHRFSIEWSRIEPAIGVYDTNEIAHYHSVLTSLKAHGLKPIVTLEHYTLPIWADNPLGPTVTGTAGWASQTTQDEFVKWTGDMAQEFGGDVDDWIVFNEPMVAAVAAFQGVFPPASLNNDLGKTTAMVAAMIRTHARAYDAIHARDTVDADTDGVAAKVGIAQAVVDFFPQDPASNADVQASARLDHIFNKLFVDAITKGDLDLDLDGAYTGPGEGQAIASLKDRLDFIGVNYYRKYLVIGVLPEPILGVPTEDPNLPHNDLGWSIYPKGIYDALAEMNGYGLPLLITENGTADAADKFRPRYLVDHLLWVQRAIADGMPVTGYLQWSLMDNFEWAEGFSAKFGELKTDYATQARVPTTSSAAYSEICHADALTSHVQDRYRSEP